MQIIPSNNAIDEIKITYSEDASEAFMIVPPEKGGNFYTVDELVVRIKMEGIKVGIDLNEVKRIISEKLYYIPVKIAVGKKPKAGKDGWYEFLFKTDIDNKPKILKDGSVDYSAYGEVPTVVEGQEIVIYHPAVMAVDGVNVKGETIVAKKGKDLAKLKGKGFVIDKTGEKYLAKYDGKVTYKDERLVVDKELLISGDVSYTTGDVEFQNDIHIRGNVLAGMKITSLKGSIIVDGYVEAATLTAQYDVTLKNGMQGNGKGIIEAGGDVTGKFFERVKINAGGDVKANAIMNSDVESGQDVIVSGKYGIIIGGYVKAVRYINTTIIGNLSEVKTNIEAGFGGDLFSVLAKCENERMKAEQELDKIVQTLEQIDVIIEKVNRSDLQQKKLMLMRTKIEKDMTINELTKEKQKIVEKMGKANLAKVTINKVVYPGTVIIINGMKVAVEDENSHVEYARRGSGIIVYNIGE